MKYMLAFALTSLSLISSSQTESNSLLLTNATYLDVTKGKYVKGVDILLENGKIASLGKKVAISEETVKMDVSGKFIIPGLIDSHVHFFQSGGLYTRPDGIDLTSIRPYEEERKWLLDNFDDLAIRYLAMGITTVLDAGGPMTNFDLRDRSKKTPSPNLIVTGPLISTYQPEAFQIDDPPIIKANSEQEARNLVKKQLGFKPDFIKIWYLDLRSLPADSSFNMVKAAINESHIHELPVAVHATELKTAKLAIRAGADFLVHSVKDEVLDEEFIQLLKKNKVTLIPTLIVAKKGDEVLLEKNNFSRFDLALANPTPLGSLFDIKHLESQKNTFTIWKNWVSQKQPRAKKEDSIRSINLKILVENGINIATGTDAGNTGVHHGSSYYEEIVEMSKAGLSNLEILQASTINASKILEKTEKVGSIEVNKKADLLICSIDPLKDLSFMKSIDFIIKDGLLINSDTIIKETPEQLVQRQVNGYNARNVDAFLAPYADNTKIFNFPKNLSMETKEKMRPVYAKIFNDYPDLHCEIKKRTILGNTVIDHEIVTWTKDDKSEAIAIYKIKGQKIAEVYFISE